MVGLGHEVSFGGMFVSDLETGKNPFLSFRYCVDMMIDDDHNRLKNIRAKLYRSFNRMFLPAFLSSSAF